jgi:hypothetical protein
MEPTPARVVHAGGPRDGREDVLEVPADIPTIVPVDVPVDAPLGCCVPAEFLPDGR